MVFNFCANSSYTYLCRMDTPIHAGDCKGVPPKCLISDSGMIVICLKALLDDLEIHQDLGGDFKDVFWWRCSPWSLGRWPRPAASCLILLLPFKIGSQWIPTIRGVYRLGFIKGNTWRGPHHFHYFLIVPIVDFLRKLPIHMNLRKVVGQCRHHEALLSQPATERSVFFFNVGGEWPIFWALLLLLPTWMVDVYGKCR